MRAARRGRWAWGIVITLAGIGAACAKHSSKVDPRVDENGLFGDQRSVLVEEGAPPAAPLLFERAAEGSVDAPCMIEPEGGTLYPKNWLPPRFSWQAVSNANVFELRVRANGRPNEIVVYTSARSWTMPSQAWASLQGEDAGAGVTVELRGAFWNGRGIQDLTTRVRADLAIAPVEAPGSIVFWSLGEGRDDSRLRGLTLAAPGIVDVLSAGEMPGNGSDERKCIGCHTATPDGKDVAVTWQHDGSGGYSNDLARIERGIEVGQRPAYESDAAKEALAKRGRMFTAFSGAHWAPGDRMMLTSDGEDLLWVDVEGASAEKATGVLGKEGDPNPRRLAPSWSHDGRSIVYMSGALGEHPFVYTGPSDLYVMPYGDREGATEKDPARPIRGASSLDVAEYYPSLSPDDAWVAFNALPDNGRLYDNPNSEIFIVPREGGDRVRLRANDLPACFSKKTPGVANSWPKWAPAVQEKDGRKFYFVVFSSRRHPMTDKPQLYVAPVVVEANGAVTSYPAVYLRNQESFDGWERWGNHTPAWDQFVIQPEPVVK